jgi:NAD+ kinase
MSVEVNDRTISSRVLNEALFCHASPAATSRYILRVEDPDDGVVEEEQRSSGLWVGPAAGSTAAQKSAGGRVLPLLSRKVQVVVREPYTAIGKTIRYRRGLVGKDGRVTLISKMREAKLFLDGHDRVFDVTIGDVVVMRRAAERLTVLGLRSTR